MWDPNVGMGTVTHQTIGYVFPMGPYYWLVEQARRARLGRAAVLARLDAVLRGGSACCTSFAHVRTARAGRRRRRARVHAVAVRARLRGAHLGVAAAVGRVAVDDRRHPQGAVAAPPARARELAISGDLRVDRAGHRRASTRPRCCSPASDRCAGSCTRGWSHATSLFAGRSRVTVRTGVLTLLTSLWWIAGLRMQAAYGLDILKYTETVDAVARTSSPNEVLRGLGYWFFYGQDRLGPWIEAARDYTQLLRGDPRRLLARRARTASAPRSCGGGIASTSSGAGARRRGHRRRRAPVREPDAARRAVQGRSRTSSTAGLAMRSTGRAVPLVVLALAVFLGLATNVVSDRLRGRAGSCSRSRCRPSSSGSLLVNFPALYDGTYYGKNLQRPEEIPYVLEAGDRVARATAATHAGARGARVPTSRRTAGATRSTRSRPA